MFQFSFISVPAGNYIFKISSRSTKTRSEICSRLTIKTLERRQEHPCQNVISIKLFCNFIEITLRHGCSWRHSSVFIVNVEHILHLVLGVSIFNFEQVNASWGYHYFLKLITFSSQWLQNMKILILDACVLFHSQPIICGKSLIS